MSIDINWESLTSGADGTDLAEAIRAFIDDKFQQVALPKFIRSVKVHTFDLGTCAPQLEIKDVCDPLPDFYEDEDGNDDDDEDDEDDTLLPLPATHASTTASTSATSTGPAPADRRTRLTLHTDSDAYPPRAAISPVDVFSRSSTPGIPGGTSNMAYFHLPMGAGLSGTTTPLGVFPGASFANSLSEHQPLPWNMTSDAHARLVPISETPPPPTLPSEHDYFPSGTTASAAKEDTANDVQIVARVVYAGDVKLSLTAEILLDYPMPSFVGIPLELHVTGMTFDGVAIVAYINHKAHFCFLSPDDADALIGGDDAVRVELAAAQMADESPQPKRRRVGGLFEQIKVETQIGRKGDGKQVLKNVGKVEAFALEQVRKIFEDEFVYPSFWTFLV